MNVYALDDVHVEAGALDLTACFLDFVDFPDLTGLLVVQRPYQTGNARNLLDLLRCDAVVALAVPAECHFHCGEKPPFLLCMNTACSG